MPRKSASILSDAARGHRIADCHEIPRHHRYYGSSAITGGERIIERRSGFGVPNLAGL